MSSSPLRIGLIGLRGINFQFYAPAVQRVEGATIAAGVDPAPEARQAFAESHPAVPTFASLADALQQQQFEAVVIGTPNPIHLTNIREAAGAKLHMLVTKPLCNTVAECREAVALAERAEVVLQSGHEFRFRPGPSRAIAMARDGQAGKISLVTAHMGHGGGLNPKLSGPGLWRNDPANCPGGSANLLSVHHIDIAIAVLGAPLRVQATLGHLAALTPMEDTTVITTTHERGVSVCTSSYISPAREELVIHGTEKNLIASDRSLSITQKRDPPQSVTDLATSKSSDILIEQLVAAVRHGQPVQTDGRTGLLNVAVLEAALISSRERRDVELGEILKDDEIQ